MSTPHSDESTEDHKQLQESIDHLASLVDGKTPLQEIAGLADKDVHAILQLGATLYSQGRRNEAEDLFRGAVLLNKENGLAHSGLGTVLTAQGHVDEAIETLNEAIRLLPEDIASYVNRAENYLKRAQFEEATADLKKALELDPEEQDPAANRARAIIVGMSELIKEMQAKLERGEDLD